MDRRTLLALALSFFLLVAYQWFLTTVAPPVEEPAPVATTAPAGQDAAGKSPAAATPLPAGQPPTAVASALQPTKPAAPVVREENAPSVLFKGSLVEARLSTRGARMMDLRFLKHAQDLTPQGLPGDPIHYLSLANGALHFQEGGFLAGPEVRLPNRETLWKVVGPAQVEGAGEIHLQWDNGQGLLFEKVLTFRPDSYVITATDRVTNTSPNPVALFHFSHFIRVQPPVVEEPIGIVDYEGPMGFLDGVRVMHPYEELAKAEQSQQSQHGWIGFSEKYFLSAVIPTIQGAKRYYFDYDAPAHRAGYVSGRMEVAPGAQGAASVEIFVGPKEVQVLNNLPYELDRSIDYGWFHFLAAPLVELLLFFNKFLHNFGLAIILLTILIKLIFYPLATKSYRSMNDMKLLQPKVEQLRKMYATDKTRLNQEMMRLYQEHKVNPLGGCLPIVVQIPVFFALYKVLILSVEMRHTPFIFWIHDLSAKDPYFVLPLLMGVSMFIQTKMNPAPPDPTQAKIMLFLPVIFTFMFLQFPSGLVLYWLLNNVLSIGQQYYISQSKV